GTDSAIVASAPLRTARHLRLLQNPPFFFFSSRRRHTISKRDWSSDVCSSDLFPQYRHVSATSSCSNGIHLDVTCVSSFIFSSQAWSPHHIAFIKPGFSSNAVVNSSILVTVVIL